MPARTDLWPCANCGFANLPGDASCFICHHDRYPGVRRSQASAPPQVRSRLILLVIALLVGSGAALAGLVSLGANPGTAPAPSPEAQVAGDTTERSAAPIPSDAFGTYTVRPGDTLFSIAVRIGVSEAQLRWWNLDRYPSLRTNPRDITVGWVLIIEGQPMPTPTPRPTSPPTPVPSQPPPVVSGPTGGGTGWTYADYLTAVAYRDSAWQTYAIDVPGNVSHLYDIGCVPGLSPEECAARYEVAAIYRDAAINSINGHLSFMSSRPPAPCFGDAYQEDRSVAQQWLDALQTGQYGTPNTGEGRYQNQLYDAAISRSNAFLTDFAGYFSDCG